MSQLRMTKSYQVKRTANGRVRFSLGAGTHQQLRELLVEVADSEALDALAELTDVYIMAGQRLAQELITRRTLLMTLAGDNRFVLTMHEATTLLALLWVEVGSGAYGGLVTLFGDLHQLLN